MKVLHGISEVAGQGTNSVKGLRKLGINAKMVTYRTNRMKYDVDYDLKIGHCKWLYPFYMLKALCFAVFSIFKYDCFHFHFGHTLIPSGIDLFFFKLLKKKVFLEFHGSDIRWAFCRKPYLDMDMPLINEKYRKEIKYKLSFADGIILHDQELIEHLPPTDIPVYIVPLRVSVNDFTPNYPDTNIKKPIIVHAPSSRKIKGTEYILKALEEIELDYELILVEGKTQDEAFKIYSQADIIIDQLLIGSYGVFAIEAMAMGKPVVTHITEEMRKSFPEELPIVEADIFSIKKVLEELIMDASLRHDLGVKGREYVCKYHDCNKNSMVLKNIYLGKQKPMLSRDVFDLINRIN